MSSSRASQSSRSRFVIVGHGIVLSTEFLTYSPQRMKACVGHRVRKDNFHHGAINWRSNVLRHLMRQGSVTFELIPRLPEIDGQWMRPTSVTGPATPDLSAGCQRLARVTHAVEKPP